MKRTLPALLVVAFGCGDGAGAEDFVTDTLAELLPPPEASRAACEAAGWTWLRDSSYPYCPGGWDGCEWSYYCYCVLPCETDADCAPYTTRHCVAVALFHGIDSAYCSGQRICRSARNAVDCADPEVEGPCE